MRSSDKVRKVADQPRREKRQEAALYNRTTTSAVNFAEARLSSRPAGVNEENDLIAADPLEL